MLPRPTSQISNYCILKNQPLCTFVLLIKIFPQISILVHIFLFLLNKSPNIKNMKYRDFCIVSSKHGISQNHTFIILINFGLSYMHSRGAMPRFCPFPLGTPGCPQIISNLIFITPKKQ